MLDQVERPPPLPRYCPASAGPLRLSWRPASAFAERFGGPPEPWRRWSAGPDLVARALKALNLVLQAGGFACVVLDLADVQPAALKRIPFTTWLRVQRVIEGSDTACVLVAPQPLARSAGGLTLSLIGRARWTGDADRNRQLTGADLAVRVVSPRRRVDGEVRISTFANATH